MMRDYEKEVERYSLEEEMRMMEDLEEIFQEASVAIQGKIKNFLSRSDANETHVQNQLDIQNARLAEISAIIALLQTKEFETIDEFLHTSYEIGFTGTLYGLQKQGIPLLFPIDQRQVANAMIRSSKLIKDLRSTVNMNSKVLQSAVKTELAKGIAMGSSYAEIARGIDRKMNTGMKVAMRIARTEGARINQESRFDAAKKAKEAGADLVKQWDSTLDGRTRPTHRKLDGQIRELDEPFEVDGKTAQHPCGFGIASEDINCRCIMLTRARWALEDEEQNSFTKNVEGEIVEFENVKDYEDFKENFFSTDFRKMSTSSTNSAGLEIPKPIVNSYDKLKTLRNDIKNNYGFNHEGLKHFTGDTEMLMEQVVELSNFVQPYGINEPITLKVDKFMGNDDFAQINKTANGFIITFNEKYLRDRKFTNATLSADNFLASNEAIGIVRHEVGHLLDYKLGKDIQFEIAEQACKELGLNVLEEIASISDYALDQDENGVYIELTPEVFAKNLDSPTDFTRRYIKIFKEKYYGKT